MMLMKSLCNNTGRCVLLLSKGLKSLEGNVELGIFVFIFVFLAVFSSLII